jgi:hypothetical protein
MAAANTDLVRNASPNFATALTSSMLSSDTSMTVASTTGLPTGTAVTLVIDATDPISGTSTPTLKEVVTGVVTTSTNIGNLLRGKDGTTAQAHTSNANVTMWITANLWNDFQTSYLAQHTQAGYHTGLSNTGGMSNSGGFSTDSITVSGTATLPALGNTTISGTLGVSGATTLSGATTHTGALTANGVTTFNNAVAVTPISTTNGTSNVITPTLTSTMYIVNALTGNGTINAPTGTPTADGQTLIIRIRDNGSQYTLAWNSIYNPVVVTLPTLTHNTLYVGTKWNSVTSKWDVLSVGGG